ncbi:MAG: prepilin-type N-terminal cleavage/methylation domain-containing protein [Pseudomonadota bacterium]
MKHVRNGFTLMEMIGVVAVIAILASMATPMIFDAIRNSRVSATLQDVRAYNTAIVRYYTDTGTFPQHRNPVASSWERQLIVNTDQSGNPVPGWDGPYLEADLVNRFSPGEEVLIYSETRSTEMCDIDGDGNPDRPTMIVRYNIVDDTAGKKLSNAIDNDGTVTSGTGAWNVAGRVRRSTYRSNGITICISTT